MGAADVVPGVSGGTIAFISGIYEELLDSINSVNLGLLRTLRKEGIKAAWKAVNGNFLVCIFLGIGISIFSLAKVVEYLLHHHPVLLWAFFFGLVIASVWLVGKQVKQWGVGTVIAIIAGTAIAYTITILPPMKDPGASWFIFVSGMIAICAMILPGISGSFILLLLGSYATILAAVSNVDLTLIGLFAGGALVGLLSFARVLKWMFKKYHDITVALLTGFLVGSLNKIWPWKITQTGFIKNAGEADEEIVPIIQDNVLPEGYRTISEFESVTMGLTDKDPQLMYAILAAVGGFLIIFLMERFAGKKQEA